MYVIIRRGVLMRCAHAAREAVDNPEYSAQLWLSSVCPWLLEVQTAMFDVFFRPCAMACVILARRRQIVVSTLFAGFFCPGVGYAVVKPGVDVPPPQWSAVEIPAGRIDQAVARLASLAESLRDATGVPGLAVAVVHGDRLLYARGFGRRRAGFPEAVDADTVFQLASVSKPLGATVVAAAVGRGGIGWDTPLAAVSPGFRLSDPFVSRSVTVGDLYAHRSGLPDHAGDSLEDLGYDRAAILDRLRHLPLAPFRAVHAYTNFGLTAAAEAVATAHRMPWARLSDELIYRPLAMTSTSSDFADYAARRNKAVGHVREGTAWLARAVRQPDAQSPAGGASSNVRDMARWLQMVLGLGVFGGKEIVDRAALLEALAPQIRSDAPAPPVNRASFYGYGIGVTTDGVGRVRLSHSGGFALGAAAQVMLLPSENLGIVTLTNGMPIGVPEALNASFMDLVETGAVQRDWLDAFWTHAFAGFYRNPSALAGQQQPATAEPARLLQAYAGRYANDYYGEVRVVVDAGQLTMAIGPKPMRFRLTHWRGDQFSYQPVGENAVGVAAVTFRSDVSGRIGSLEIENLESGVRLLTRQGS